MSIPVYPTLSQNPEFPIIWEPIFDTSVLPGAGKVEQRVANWPQEKRRFRFHYQAILTDDKKMLWDFWMTVNGSYKQFTWTNPETSVVYTVKFEIVELQFSWVRNTLLEGIQEKVWNTGEIRLIQVI